MTRSVLCALVCVVLCSSGPVLAQTAPGANEVPFISEVTPPSLPVTGNSGPGSATLTILGANFPQNAVVNLTFLGTAVHPTSMTVNSGGSTIVAQFSGNIPSAPAVFEVTVTNPYGTTTTSNIFYLPQTPTTPSVLLSQNVTNLFTGNPQSLVAADLTANGLPSLAIVSQNPDSVFTELDIYSGYESGYLVTTGQRPYGIAPGEFLLGDNLPEFAVTNSSDNSISLLVANGTNGSYRLFSTVSVPGVFPTGIVAGDFNRDGLLDLAVVNTCGAQTPCFPQAAPLGPGSITILLGNGDGTFSVSPAQLATGNIPYAIAAADLNGDGILDLVVANSTSNTLSVFMGNGDGTFTPATASPATGNGPMALVIGDFNSDGFLDLAVANSNDNTVSILLNQNCPSLAPAACSFALASVSPSVGGGPIAIATGDLNADGFLDLVVADASANMVTVLLGDSTGAFTTVVPAQSSPNFATGAAPDGVVLADFNQDGRLDIITSNRSGSYSVLRQAAVMQLQLTTSLSTFVYGYVPTLTVQLMPPPGAPAGPAGTVTLFEGSTQVTSTTLSGTGNQFQFMLPPGYFFGAGTHQLTAVYSGDSNFSPVTSNAVTETVLTSATTTTLSSNVTNAPYGTSITLTASIQPQAPAPTTGTVTFIDTTNSTTLGTATVSNNSAQLTLTNLTAGLHTIQANYQGDGNCAGSGSSLVSVNITQASATVNLSVSPAQAQFAQSVMFTVALQTQSGGSGVPTGAMSFYDGSTLLSTAPIANNSATFSTSTLALGSHIISAQYSGDANFLSASSGSTPITVTKAATTTIVTSNLAPSVYGQNVTFSATTTPAFGSLPAGQISFFDGTSLLATVNATNGVAQLTLQSLTGGTHSITAQWLPTYNYATSTSAPLTQIVTPAATTISLSTNPNPSTYGQQIQLNVAIDSTNHYLPNGVTVNFFDNGSPLGPPMTNVGSSASFLITLTAGTHVLTATCAGDGNLQASSTASGLTQTVNQASTSSSAFLTSYSTLYGASVTITGVVSSPFSIPDIGTVSFYDGTTILGTAPVSSGRSVYTTSSLLPGTHPITVQYNANANLSGSTSSPAQTLTVSKDPTLTSVSVDVNPSTYGQTVTLTATVQLESGSGATGSVSFLDGTTVLGSAPYANGGAKLAISTMGGGSHSITAQYSGDSYFASSTSTALTQTVNPAPTSINVASGTNPSTFGQAVTLTATVQPPAGTTATGTVTFMDGSYAIGTSTLANNVATLTVSWLSPGSHTITAVYAGNANLSGSSSGVITETITQAATTTAVASSLNPASFGQCVQLSATVQPASGTTKATGTVSFLDGTTSIGTGTLANNAATLSYCGFGGGAHSITANYSGDSNYISSVSAALTETINPVSSSVAVASNQNPAPFGSAVTFTATVLPSVNGASTTGSVTFFDGSTALGTATVSSSSAQLSVASLTPGPHSITAKYGGDGNFNGSTSATLTQTVNAAPTTTTVSLSLNPANYGQSVTLSASIQPPSGIPATGTVTFFDGSASLGTASISSNTAQLALSSFLAGTHSITAAYSGNSSLAGSTSVAASEVVNPASTTTTINSSVNPASAGQTVTFTFSVQPAYGGTAGGTVSLYDSTTLLGTMSLVNNAGQLSFATLGAGSHSITAKYNGDSNTTASTSVVLTQTISQASTTTAFTASPNPSVFNQSVSFVITVSPAAGGTPTGTVSLIDGSTTLTTATLSGGTARIYYGGLSPATHSMTAVYSGDPNFSGSTSAAQNIIVNQAATSTSLGSSLNPSTFGQAVTLTATVQAPQGINSFGTVTFMDGSSTLGSANLSNSSAQLTLPALAAGSHTITAVYAGNTYLTGSTSAGLAQSVNAASSATTVSSSVNPTVFGQTVVLSAAIQPAFGGSATGTVTFLDGAVALGSSPVSGNAAQLSLSSLAIGSHSITAKYSGDGNVSGSTSATLTQTINQAATTTTVTSGANPAAFGQSVTFSVKIQSSSSGTPTGTVTLLDGSSSLGSTALPSNGVAQFTISSLTPGAHAISASYGGDANFAPSTAATLTETINQASTTTTMTSATNPAMFDQSVVFSVKVQSSSSGTPTGTVTLLDGSSSLGSTALPANGVAQFTISNLALGSHAISASYSGDSNFAPGTAATLTETVNQASTIATVTSGTDPSAFDQAVTFTVKIQPSSAATPTGTVTLLDGSTSLGSASLPTSGVVQFTVGTLLAGSHSITATYSGDNYFLASTSAALGQTVNQAPTTTAVTSSANPSSYGQPQTFTASVATPYGGSPTGTVTFFDGGTQIGSASVSGGFAKFTTGATTLNAGAHSIVASYGGDANFTGSSSAAWSQTVSAAATSTTLVSSLNPSVFGQSVTFTATVSSAVSGTQSGAVSFYVDGSTTPAQTSTVSGGAAQFSTSSLAGGGQSVTATFASSNPNFQGSSSAALTQNVKDFSVSSSPASLTISRGHSGTTTLTVSPVLGFTGNVSLSCSGAPANTTCSLSPTQVSLNGSSVNSVVTIHVNQKASAGNYTLTLTGVSGSISHTTMLALTVQ